MSIFTRLRNARVKPLPVQEFDLAVYDSTPYIARFDIDSLEVIRWAPVWMSLAERLLLYTLTYTLRPMRYLEIGTFQGGSALVVNAALDALKSDSRIVCIDPQPQIKPEHWDILSHRATVIQGYSPHALPQAVAAVDGLFDLVLIDGDHSYEGVIRDGNAVLSYVTDRAYLLFHDSFFVSVRRGLDDFARKNAYQIVDFGPLTREVIRQAREDGSSVCWGGLRLMQVRR